MRHLIQTLVFGTILLAGCATSSVYHPQRTVGGEGFSETMIAPDRYRVTFRGRETTPREVVEDYLLLHAAEIALEQGRAGFVMTEADVDEERTGYTASAPAFFGRVVHVGPRRSYPFYAYGYDWGYDWDHPRALHYAESSRYVAVAYIRLLDEAGLSLDPQGFDARQVMANMGPVSCYREEAHDETRCPLAHNHDG